MKKLLLVLLIVVSMSSCLISLHPLYSEDTIVMEPLLAGHWESEDGSLPLSDSKIQSLDFRMKKDLEDVSFKKNEDGVIADAEIKQESTGHYELVHQASENDIYQYDAVLLKLGKYHYLNVYPDGPVNDADEITPALAANIPTNNFYKVVFKGEKEFSLYPFDSHRMEELIK
ncbi:MAG: hypothetical protein AAF242_08660, partial [Bacteroidota bacterium]